MALTTMAAINAAAPGQSLTWQKSVNGGAGIWFSLWLGAGSPGQGVAPSSGLAGDVPTKATLGAPNFVNPASGNSYLGRVENGVAAAGATSLINAVLLYDRLWHNSGINVTIATAQTINSVALTRPDALGASVEAWFEVYVVMGAGTPTVTLAYTDQSGNLETTGSSGALPTVMSAGRTQPFQLATGDTGVRSIQTWTASATFTSGTIGLVLRRQVAALFPRNGISVPSEAMDAIAVGLPRIYDNACLELLWLCSSPTSMAGSVTAAVIQG